MAAAAAVSFTAATRASGIPLQTPHITNYARHVCRRTSTGAAAAAAVLANQNSLSTSQSSSVSSNGCETTESIQWRKISSKELGITHSMIAKPTRSVLNALHKNGFAVYLVGGCVRDLILKRTPKDFDIITSADLREVQKVFSRCDIVGRRFPICHVHVNNTIVEVSSFSTVGRSSCMDVDYMARSPECSEDDYIRWKNCLRRDFTINGFMFDPYVNVIYDYVGGMEDIKKAKVRTVISAYTSFQEDCARILRAIRIASRLGFRFTKETAHSIKDLATSILKLDKSRLLMEVNYMLAYGSAEPSLRLLWKFGLLELLLPIQAAYFVSQGFSRRDKRSNMLLSLFANLDRLLAPDRPCHSCLWVSLLAFHQALVWEPKDPLVVATFTLALHNGGDLAEAVSIARRIQHPCDTSLSELSKSQGLEADAELMHEVLTLASSVRSSLCSMTDEIFVSRAMARYPKAPYSDLVLVPLHTYLKVGRIFDCVGGESKSRGFPKRGSKIDYHNLALGGFSELRHVFARVVFDTIYPPNLEAQSSVNPI